MATVAVIAVAADLSAQAAGNFLPTLIKKAPSTGAFLISNLVGVTGFEPVTNRL